MRKEIKVTKKNDHDFSEQLDRIEKKMDAILYYLSRIIDEEGDDGAEQAAALMLDGSPSALAARDENQTL